MRNLQESVAKKQRQLVREAEIYTDLQGGEGIPRAYGYFEEGEYNALVIELLGQSIESLYKTCNKRFTLATTLSLASQMVLST